MAQSGSIQLIIGPMFSGKTSYLIASIERHLYANRKCMIIKHTLDTRYDKFLKNPEKAIMTHSGRQFDSADIHVAANLDEMNGIVDSYDVIGISEANFYPDLCICAEDWANAGKIVIVEGLSGNFGRSHFGQLYDLIPKAEKIKHLSAICECCGNDAAFTGKRHGGKPKAPMTLTECESEAITSPRTLATRETKSSTEIDVGGADKYVPLCRKCYNSAFMTMI